MCSFAQSNETMSDTATAVGITTWSSTIIHCHSPRYFGLLHRPDRQGAWGCGRNHHVCIFQVLDDDANLYSDLWVLQYWFWFTILLGKSGPSWLLLGLFHHNHLHSTCQGTSEGILSTTEYFFLLCTLNWGNSNRMGWGTHYFLSSMHSYPSKRP